METEYYWHGISAMIDDVMEYAKNNGRSVIISPNSKGENLIWQCSINPEKVWMIKMSTFKVTMDSSHLCLKLEEYLRSVKGKESLLKYLNGIK